MQFNLYATFRLIAGSKTASLDLPEGTTVREAVTALVGRHPALRTHWLNEAGEIHAHVHVFINDVDVHNLEHGFDTPLMPEDVLDFLPPVGGG